MSQVFTHESVLLSEAMAALAIKQDGRYIDGTYGRGGHSKAMLSRLGTTGALLAVDKDPTAVEHAASELKDETRFCISHSSYKDINTLVNKREWLGQVDGVLLDLGMSSPQIDDASRGFSFQNDGELDMRMNTKDGITAAQWLANVKEKELVRVFREYGEERYAKRISRAIVKERETENITRTKQLAEIIARAHPAWEKGKDPATRCFQAIRIYLNRELGELQECLDSLIDVLAVNGRLVVISFHSLEDRIVKRFINKACRGDDYPPDLPVTQAMLKPTLRKIGKVIRASETEVKLNPRARSAVMRVAEKIAQPDFANGGRHV